MMESAAGRYPFSRFMASPSRAKRDRILDACRLPAVSSRPRKTVRWDLVEIAASRTEEGDRELLCNDCLDGKSIRQCERVLTLCPRTSRPPAMGRDPFVAGTSKRRGLS